MRGNREENEEQEEDEEEGKMRRDLLSSNNRGGEGSEVPLVLSDSGTGFDFGIIVLVVRFRSVLSRGKRETGN